MIVFTRIDSSILALLKASIIDKLNTEEEFSKIVSSVEKILLNIFDETLDKNSLRNVTF